MFNICKMLIEANRIQGIEEKMGTLLMVNLLTKDELTQLMAMIPQPTPTEQPKLEQPVEDTEILK